MRVLAPQPSENPRRRRWALPFLCALTLLGCDKVKAFIMGEPSREERAEVLRQKAAQAEAEGNDKAAISGYEGVRSILVNDASSSLALGRLYEKGGNDTQAILSLKAAADVDDSPEIRKRLAAIYLRHGNATEAARLLKDLTNSDSTDLDSQLKLVRTLIFSGKADDALAQASDLLAKNPNNVDVLDLKAEALLAKGKGDEAAGLLDAAVAANPHSVEVRLARAKFLSERGLPDKALSELERIDPASATRPEVVFGKADQLMRLKRFDDANKLVGDYIAEHPNDLEGQATLGTIRVAAGDYDGARSAAEGVLTRMPHNLVALFVRARCLEQSAPLDRAIAGYREVLDQDEGNTDALHRIWPLYEKNGELPDTIAALENLDSRGIASPDEQLELARLYADTGLNSSRGLKLLAAVARANPKAQGLDAIRKKLSAGTPRAGAVQVIRSGH